MAWASRTRSASGISSRRSAAYSRIVSSIAYRAETTLMRTCRSRLWSTNRQAIEHRQADIHGAADRLDDFQAGASPANTRTSAEEPPGPLGQ